MKLAIRISQCVVSAALVFGGMSTAVASDKTTNTVFGAGLGAAAGALLSEGDPLTILGGAAAGGVLGHILTPEKHPSRHWHGDQRKVAKRPMHTHRHKHYRQVKHRSDRGYHVGHYKKRHRR